MKSLLYCKYGMLNLDLTFMLYSEEWLSKEQEKKHGINEKNVESNGN